jgi:hypothetical protein
MNIKISFTLESNYSYIANVATPFYIWQLSKYNSTFKSKQGGLFNNIFNNSY